MYCPKCGTQNPDDGKFCRSCGVDIKTVNEVLTTGLPTKNGSVFCGDPNEKLKDPAALLGGAIRNLMMGMGFLVVGIVLAFTNAAGGRGWWWAMMFPAFSLIATAAGRYVQYRQTQNTQNAVNGIEAQTLRGNVQSAALPNATQEYIAPDYKYQTGDPAPRSVTATTTNNLSINTEGETMSLPQNEETGRL